MYTHYSFLLEEGKNNLYWNYEKTKYYGGWRERTI